MKQIIVGVFVLLVSASSVFGDLQTDIQTEQQYNFNLTQEAYEARWESYNNQPGYSELLNEIDYYMQYGSDGVQSNGDEMGAQEAQGIIDWITSGDGYLDIAWRTGPYATPPHSPGRLVDAYNLLQSAETKLSNGNNAGAQTDYNAAKTKDDGCNRTSALLTGEQSGGVRWGLLLLEIVPVG